MSERDQEESSYDIEQYTTNEEMMDLDPVGEEFTGLSIAEQDAEINQNNYDTQTAIAIMLKEFKNMNEKLDRISKDHKDQAKVIKDLTEKVDRISKDQKDLTEKVDRISKDQKDQAKVIKDLDEKMDKNTKDQKDQAKVIKDLDEKMDKNTKDLNEWIQGKYPLKYLSQVQLDDCVQDIKESETAMISGKVLNLENLLKIAEDNQENLFGMFDDIMNQLLHRPEYKYDYDLMGKIHRVILTFPFHAWWTPTDPNAVGVLRGGSESNTGRAYHLIKPVIVGNYQENLSLWLQEADSYIVDVMTRRFMIEPDTYYDKYYRRTQREIVVIDVKVEKALENAIGDHYVKTCNILLGEAFKPLAYEYGLSGNLKPDFVHSKPMTIYEPDADQLNRVLEKHLIEEQISFQPDSEDLRCRQRYLINRQLITESVSVSAKRKAYRSEVKETFRRKLIYDHWKKNEKAESKPIALVSEVKVNLLAMMYMRNGGYQIKINRISGSIFRQLFTYLLESRLTYCILEDYFVSLVLDIEWDSDEFKKRRKEYEEEEKKNGLRNASHSVGGNISKRTNNIKVRPVAYRMERIDEGKSKYTSLAVLFALVYHGLTMSDDERAEQEKVIREAALYLRKSARFTLDESEKRLAVRVALDTGSSRSNFTRNIDPLTEGGPRRMIDCRCQEWTGFELLQDERYNSQVYLFDFDTISSYMPDLKTAINTKYKKQLRKDQKVVMKVYNIDLTSIHYTQDISNGSIFPNVTLREYEKWCDDCYFNEIESYHRIIKYNNSLRTANGRINIPEIYLCGSIRVYSEENGYEFTGFFILMEYIDAKPKPLSNGALQVGMNTLKKAGKLGISHNDITTKNVLVKDGQMVLIDFSNASISTRPVDTTEDRRALEEVWKQLRSKGMIKNKKENQAEGLESTEKLTKSHNAEPGLTSRLDTENIIPKNE